MQLVNESGFILCMVGGITLLYIWKKEIYFLLHKSHIVNKPLIRFFGGCGSRNLSKSSKHKLTGFGGQLVNSIARLFQSSGRNWSQNCDNYISTIFNNMRMKQAGQNLPLMGMTPDSNRLDLESYKSL